MAAVSEALLAWYDHNRRRLVWRAAPGETPDPYRVWLSEIMLQQTTTGAAGPYYIRFLERFPTVDALAAADLDEVLRLWAGLGYYARARNLHRCAKLVVERHASRFPETEEALLALPGIGAYTAAAIAAIAFDQPATVVDGNVERVVSRLFALPTPLPQAKPELRRLATTLTPTTRPGDFAQAMMDLGATLCSPTNPACGLCPLRPGCRAHAEGAADRYPARSEKPPKPTRHGTVFWLQRGDGMVLLRRRPERGLLGGMMEVPGTDWTDTPPSPAAVQAAAPMPATWRRLDGVVTHTFTHFHLELTVLTASVRLADARLGTWVAPDDLAAQALPTLFRKVIRLALKSAGRRG
ncbi:MAG: A/G-specific adenine glycosylase [Alphaproteobacteria bacterium]|nr:A/G-specific adenine glycosylase [Alphaproteobacteria bacterium]TAD87483.1 MAG: A/G-specific adenine glycosylase [Alphaproteobacteria bacterium]